MATRKRPAASGSESENSRVWPHGLRAQAIDKDENEEDEDAEPENADEDAVPRKPKLKSAKREPTESTKKPTKPTKKEGLLDGEMGQLTLITKPERNNCYTIVVRANMGPNIGAQKTQVLVVSSEMLLAGSRETPRSVCNKLVARLVCEVEGQTCKSPLKASPIVEHVRRTARKYRLEFCKS